MSLATVYSRAQNGLAADAVVVEVHQAPQAQMQAMTHLALEATGKVIRFLAFQQHMLVVEVVEVILMVMLLVALVVVDEVQKKHHL